MKRTCGLSIIMVVIAFLSGCSLNIKNSGPEKPNIILINIDDLGWRDVGFMGSEFYETPNIDALATMGMVFSQAYAASSNCAPSRASMMSGQWTPRHGIYTVNNSDRGSTETRKLIPVKNNIILADSNYTIAEALRDAGYITCHAGKWHLNVDPKTQGFDVNIGGCEAGNPGSYYPPYKNVPLEAPTDSTYLTDLIMDLAIQFVDSIKDDQFFLYYAPYAVHTPLHPVNTLLDKYNSKPSWNGQGNAKYATMIENLDTQVGRLFDYLDKTGILANTCIIFISDNGGVFSHTKQWPLRAGKGSYYEGGIREPMFVYWQGVVEGGHTSTAPVSHLDFYPTILEIAGINIPDNKILDGESILPVLRHQGNLDERALYWHFPVYLEGGNVETQDTVFRTRPGSAIRYGDWKLIEYFENGKLELYNLDLDIGEKNNLAETNPEKLNELLHMLQTWRKEVNAPVPNQLNPDFK